MKKKQKKVHKYLKISIFIFVTLSLLVYFYGVNFINFLGYEQINYVENQNKMILIHKPVLDELNLDYTDTNVERAYCLGGKENKNHIIIDDIAELEGVNLTEISVRGGKDTSCNLNGKFIGILHFHLRSVQIRNYGKDICVPSANDVFNFGAMSEKFSPNFKLSIIMCNKNKLLVSNWEEGVFVPLNWKIIN